MTMGCDVCDSPLGGGFGGGGAGASTWQQHVADFSDPHRTLELVAGLIPRVTVGSAAPSSVEGCKAGDWHVDLTSGNLWSCLPAAGETVEWKKVADRSPAAIDLTGYATRAMLADYATKAFVAETYVSKASVAGYNFVTQASLAAQIAPFATQAYVANAISAGGFITQSQADTRYVLAGDAAEYEYLTRSQIEEILEGYLDTSTAASTYLTVEAADAPNGFLRKNASLPYVTPAALTAALADYALTSSLSGFLTQNAADARYVQAGTGTGAAVTVGAMNAALSAYLRTADAASTLNLSTYLTIAAADASDGFVRKANFASMASAANLVTASALNTALASYVSQTNVTSIVNTAVAAVAETFATAEDLADLAASIAVESGNGTALAVLELESSSYRPAARSNNLVVLTGSTTAIPLLMPVRSEGAARDFILTVAFDRGTSMWGGQSFTVEPATRTSETVQCRFFSAEPGVFTVTASSLDLDSQMVVFGFTELADGKFLVTRKIVTDLAAGV